MAEFDPSRPVIVHTHDNKTGDSVSSTQKVKSEAGDATSVAFDAIKSRQPEQTLKKSFAFKGTPNVKSNIGSTLEKHEMPSTTQPSMTPSELPDDEILTPLSQPTTPLSQPSPPPLDPFVSTNPDFLNVTKYLPKWEEIINEADEVAGRREQVALLCKDLKEANWDNIIKRYRAGNIDHLAYDALKALYDKTISIQQFSTLTSCWSMCTTFPQEALQPISLFLPTGERNPIAERAIKNSLYDVRQNNNYLLENLVEHEEQQVCDGLFDNMRTRPASEQVFFCVKDVKMKPDPENFESIRDELNENISFRILNSYIENNESYQMIPSFSMIQACVAAYGEENAVTPTPRIGLSQHEDLLQNLKTDTRDYFLSFPGISSPKQADGFDLRDDGEMRAHDLYHLFVVSKIPKACRQETANIAEVLSKLALEVSKNQNKDSMSYPWLKTALGRMLDAEFGSFRLGTRLGKDFQISNDQGLFLFELQSKFSTSTPYRMLLKLHQQRSIDRNQLTPSQLKELQEWDAIRDEIIEKGEKEFYKHLHDFEANMIPKLAKDLCDARIFERLGIDFQELGYAHSICTDRARLKLTSQFDPVPERETLFIDELLAIYRNRKKQEINRKQER